MLTKQSQNEGLFTKTKFFKASLSLALVVIVSQGLICSPISAQGTLPPDEQSQIELQVEESVPDSNEQPFAVSPQKATLLSATLPGMGQIYIGRYWMVPIIYAGFATVGYLIYFNNNNYIDFRQAYLAAIDGNPNTNPDERFIRFRTDNLKQGMEFYRRNLELSIIGAVAVYVFNILDATVYAHLLDFDVGEDLTLNIQPSVIQPTGLQSFAHRPVPGIKLSFRINTP